jgi:hypothetical protein
VGTLKDILRQIGKGRAKGEEDVRVLVDLSLREPDEACIQRLRDAGLKVEEVIGNKVIGRIAADAARSLEALPEVAGVERSVKLKPHD